MYYNPKYNKNNAKKRNKQGFFACFFVSEGKIKFVQFFAFKLVPQLDKALNIF
jgi:hypothetical protein